FRGVTPDSIPVADTVPGPGGGPATPDGFAVLCPDAAPYCTYFRPGAERNGVPVVVAADLTLWGFGIPGLSARFSARAGGDLASVKVWPGTVPRLQLLEGYVEYRRAFAQARVGRQITTSRLGYEGFDGGRLLLRDAARGLSLDGYLGWGLTRGVALPVTSPALNPLDDFQPRQRQIVAGAGAGWTNRWFDVHGDYLREVDPSVDYFVSERAGVQAVVRPVRGVTVSGGSDWDLAMGLWGSADVALGVARSRFSATVGARRYRPYFPLWTIWGAFSPVPYHATFAQLSAHVGERVDLRARGERYRYDPADVSTQLVAVENRGWRWEIGGAAVLRNDLSANAGYQAEYGPGASSAGLSGSLTYAPAGPWRLTLQGATLQRPLEFRFDESKVWSLGFTTRIDVADQLHLDFGADYYHEGRHRPDAATFDWNQLRLNARAVWLLGKSADLVGLPPAIHRPPSRD
ncbi:MAG TPA: hypothetical protein VNH46_08320, partial [Gemmatimonadales bacterium]|nr:hypothetical protein [Gemmatimonadales bacterium]